MTLQKTYNAKRGFSLIEILIVIAIVALVASMGSVFSMSSLFRTYALSERDLLVALLTQTRANALANVHGSAHSLYVDADAYVLFEGTVYDEKNTTNKIISKTSRATVSGLQTVSFAQLTAEVLSPGVLTIASDSHTYTIEINSAGRINW